MKLNELNKTNSIQSKRLGRGAGSGKGKTAGRGTKGQKSRAGHNIPRSFEGGQTPLIQKLAKKRGFRSLKVKPQAIKISLIEKHFSENDKVTLKKLFEKGLIDEKNTPVKIVSDKKSEKKYSWEGVVLNQKLLKDQMSVKSTKSVEDSKESKKPAKKVVSKS